MNENAPGPTERAVPAVAPPRRTGDVVASIVLLVLHVFLAAPLVFIAPFLVMGTDACAYQACGDEAWVTRGIATAWGGSLLALLLDLVVVCVLLARRRRAWWVPAVGCLVQVGLALVVFEMMSLAGPIG